VSRPLRPDEMPQALRLALSVNAKFVVDILSAARKYPKLLWGLYDGNFMSGLLFTADDREGGHELGFILRRGAHRTPFRADFAAYLATALATVPVITARVPASFSLIHWAVEGLMQRVASDDLDVVIYKKGDYDGPVF
jgi:hypothetical protein